MQSAENALISAALDGNSKQVRFLLAQDPALAGSSIFSAAALGDAGGLAGCLARDPALIGDLGKTDALLVHETAREGRAAALQLMAELGFDLRIKGNNGETALHWACWHGQAEAVRALVSNGADLDARESQFKAPPIGWLAHGSQHCRNPAGDYPLAAEILLKGGAEVPAGITASVEVMAVLKRFGPG